MSASSVPSQKNSRTDVSWRTAFFSLTLFGVAMGYFEAAIVVYLRCLFYPDGFSFPLVSIPAKLLIMEVGREAATIVMLVTLACAVTRKRWSRFGWFVFVFGVWDIFYYIWLGITIGWPDSLFVWDILFLIPMPWIGPVIAPVFVALLMIVSGVWITHIESRDGEFHATRLSWILGVCGTMLILWTFMVDTDAGFHQKFPEPYRYHIFAFGYLCYLAGFVIAVKNSRNGEGEE